MENLILIIIVISFLLIAYLRYKKHLKNKRAQLIDSFVFPASIANKVIEIYPHLSKQQANQVLKGLREYFHLCNIAGKRMVSMPSQVVDIAWHEFILFTREYKRFCKQSLGRFLHHIPAEAMSSPTIAQAGIKTAWKISCARENIPATSAQTLPLLFAIDKQLNIPDGFKYSLDCTKKGNNDYCASHIGCSSSTDCDGDSTGCGGGCGGD